MPKFLALLLVIVISFGARASTVAFAGALAQADVPDAYSAKYEDGRTTIVLTPRAQPKVEIRLTFNSLQAYVKQRPSIGKDMVEDACRKKGKALFAIPGNGGVAFIDFMEVRVADGERLQNTHGMMGLSNGYVTFTVTAAEEVANSAYVKDLLDRGIKDLLGRIKSREV